MSNTKLTIAAKTEEGCVRTNNEDNFTILAKVSDPDAPWNAVSIDLTDRGTLLVVADGMGGMNAGEVASGIAVEVVEQMFSPQSFKPEVLKSTATIQAFMSSVVVEADSRIKAKAQEDRETRGMGTTLVMAWLYNGFAYVCWCGDSRAYIYNPAEGLKRISKDHSLVQTLVDNGKITDDEAFESPQSNIITRCLSDSQNKAQPENAAPIELCNNDMVMLCSDGLCGMIRDRDIVQVIRAKENEPVNVMVDELVAAALRAGGKDNVTVVAAYVANSKDAAKVRANNEPVTREPSVKPQPPKKSAPAWMWAVLGAAIMAIVGLVLWITLSDKDQPQQDAQPSNTQQTQPAAPGNSTTPDPEDTQNPLDSETTDEQSLPDKLQVTGSQQGQAPGASTASGSRSQRKNEQKANKNGDNSGSSEVKDEEKPAEQPGESSAKPGQGVDPTNSGQEQP